MSCFSLNDINSPHIYPLSSSPISIFVGKQQNGPLLGNDE